MYSVVESLSQPCKASQPHTILWTTTLSQVVTIFKQGCQSLFRVSNTKWWQPGQNHDNKLVTTLQQACEQGCHNQKQPWKFRMGR